MRPTKFTLVLAIIGIMVAPPLMAQIDNDGYSSFPVQTQTRNTPSGTTVEPGSQLLYLLDTGINARELFGCDADPSGCTDTVNTLGGFTASAFQNFISVTNTNPTLAVTVHFRYFNENCNDVIDFLVVLSCNDTMLIDPFNYEIPGNNFNVGNRFFSASGGGTLGALSANDFGDGRFLLFITASGDPRTQAQVSDPQFNTDPAGVPLDTTLFPASFDLDQAIDHCDNIIESGESVPGSTVTVGELENDINPFNDDNLHVLNASAIAFDYLVGFQTVAIPPSALGISDDARFAGYGLTAWARPSVDLTEDGTLFNETDPGMNPNDATGLDPTMANPGFANLNPLLLRDGDGPHAPTGVVLAGTEGIVINGGSIDVDALLTATNDYFLRSELHGGGIEDTDNTDLNTGNDRPTPSEDTHFSGQEVFGGSLAWTLFPIDGVVPGVLPDNQYLNMISLTDDYNGSLNVESADFANDDSYRIDGADTIYLLSIFDNDEELVSVQFDIPPPISPVPGDPAAFAVSMGVRCISAWTLDNGVIDTTTDGTSVNLGNFSINDLYTAAGAFGGIVSNFLAAPVPIDGPELGPGWIRFSRTRTQVTKDQPTSELEALGMSRFELIGSDNSFVSIAHEVVIQSAFAGAWWIPTSASVSVLGDPAQVP